MLEDLRPPLAGMPAVVPTPPVIAESGDPFTRLRIVEVVSRIPRGRAVAIRAIVDRLNAAHLDWLFDERVVADTILQLQANWMADYRNASGIVIDDGPSGATVVIEDSSRVDPWIVRQAVRLESACREVLMDFSRRDRAAGEG